MLIIKYTRGGVEHLDPTFYSASCREDAEARAREVGGWVEETDLTPSEAMRRFETKCGTPGSTAPRTPQM